MILLRNMKPLLITFSLCCTTPLWALLQSMSVQNSLPWE